jgi:hypothetical protein
LRVGQSAAQVQVGPRIRSRRLGDGLLLDSESSTPVGRTGLQFPIVARAVAVCWRAGRRAPKWVTGRLSPGDTRVVAASDVSAGRRSGRRPLGGSLVVSPREAHRGTGCQFRGAHGPSVPEWLTGRQSPKRHTCRQSQVAHGPSVPRVSHGPSVPLVAHGPSVPMSSLLPRALGPSFLRARSVGTRRCWLYFKCHLFESV